MKRLFTFAIAAALTAGFTSMAWSQGGQGGGGGTSGSGGTSGAAGTSGTAGTSNTAGTPGTAGTAGRAGTPGAAGTPGTVGRAGVPGAQGTAGAAGRAQLGAGQTQAGRAQTQTNIGTQVRGFDPVSRPFFNDPGARQQLNLNDNQFNQLSRAHQDALNRFNQGVSGLNNTLTEQQRAQQIQQLRGRLNEDLSTTFDTTFTDPQVRQRFDQLNLQFQGPQAFSNPAVRQQLNLSEDQELALRRLAAGWQQSLSEMQQSIRSDPGLTQQQFNAFRTQYRQQLGTILTPAQQQAFTELTGQPYDFPIQLYLQPQAGQAPSTTFNQQPPRQTFNSQSQDGGGQQQRTVR